MSSNEEMPSLASLRRGTPRKGSRASSQTNRPPAFPSLFDYAPIETPEPSEEVTAADVIAELSRGLGAQTIPVQPERAAPERIAPLRQVTQEPKVWSVGDLVRQVRNVVEKTFSFVTVDGEISNWRPAGSGHCYFTLKDGSGQLSAVMFRKQASLLRFKPKDGDAVRVRGQVSVYEGRGQMQIIVESMEEIGQGALLAAVQRLKERLRAEGLFENKRQLPAFPKCIGVVTSLQGAALRDIVKVCRRRHAAVNLLIYPAAVQGPRCTAEVIAGVNWFSAHPEQADVVLVARGGGSWEDLHGFDDEGVARAIAACAVPVISGIGHATDSTIADSAADVCAPTPSAAAELVTAAHFRIEERVTRLEARVHRAMQYELVHARQRLARTGADTALRSFRNGLVRREQRLDELAFRVEAVMQRRLRERREHLAALQTRLQRQSIGVRLEQDKRRAEQLLARLTNTSKLLVQQRERRHESLTARLRTLSPLSVLERGYALVYGVDGRLLRSSDQVVAYDTITTRLADGAFRARVTEKLDKKA